MFFKTICTISIICLFFSNTVWTSGDTKEPAKTPFYPIFLLRGPKAGDNLHTGFSTMCGNCTITYNCMHPQYPTSIKMQGLNLCKVNTTNITDPEYEQSLIEDFSDTFTIKPKETLILSYVCSRMATWTTADSEYARKVTDTAEMLLWKPIEMLLWKPILSWSVKDTHYTFDLSNIYSMSHDMEIQIDTGRVIGFACKNLIYGEMLPSGPVYGDRPNIRGQHFLNLLNTLPAQKEFLLGRYACYFVTKEVTLHT